MPTNIAAIHARRSASSYSGGCDAHSGSDLDGHRNGATVNAVPHTRSHRDAASHKHGRPYPGVRPSLATPVLED
jgi:hypothetical protein